MVTLTPEARNRPPKRLLKIWFPSSVAVAWFVISIPEERRNEKSAPPGDFWPSFYELILKPGWPAAKPSKMRFLRRIGWLLVLISTPACAFLKMSFSSSRPAEEKSFSCREPAAKTRRQATRWRSSTSASVEDADPAVSAVVNLVSSQRGVAVRLDPHPRHGVVKDLVVLDEAKTCWVKRKAGLNIQRLKIWHVKC